MNDSEALPLLVGEQSKGYKEALARASCLPNLLGPLLAGKIGISVSFLATVVVFAPMTTDDAAETVSVLRSKLPHVKIVGVSTSSTALGNLVSRTSGFDATLTRKDGLSKFVEALKALMPEPPREQRL